MKAVYTFLSYPDCVTNCDEEFVRDAQLMGWDFVRSPLHDSDVKEDGTPKKTHYHWLVGFDKKPPSPQDFAKFIKKYSFVYHREELVVRDPVGAYEYLTHKNHPNKHQYDDSEIFRSDFWDVEKYVTQEQKNARKRALKQAGKTADLETVAKILSEIGSRPDQINSFNQLVKYATREGCLELVLDKTFFFKTYIDSTLQEYRRITQQEHEIEELKKQLQTLLESNQDLRERLEFAENSASMYYSQLFGEDPPASYEW